MSLNAKLVCSITDYNAEAAARLTANLLRPLASSWSRELYKHFMRANEFVQEVDGMMLESRDAVKGFV